MEKTTLKIGDVVQIDPAHDARFGGCFMQVTEPKSWGCQGFVAIPGQEVGKAFYRVEFSAIELIGHCAWADREEEPSGG